MSQARSSGWKALQPTSDVTVYGLSDSLTLRGFSRGGDLFRNYGLIAVRAEPDGPWLNLLIDPQGQLVCTAAAATQREADRAINVQTESLLGARFNNGVKRELR